MRDVQGRMRSEYLKCRQKLKFIDTLAAGAAVINGNLAYLEVKFIVMFKILE